MSQHDQDTDFDPDEDLFGFDEVAREVASSLGSEQDLQQIFASFREADLDEEELFPEPAPRAGPVEPELPPWAAQGAPAELELPETVPAGSAPGEAPETLPQTPALSSAHTDPPGRREAPAEPRRPEPRHKDRRPAPRVAARLSKGVIAIALSITCLNGLVALVALRGTARTPDEVSAVDRPREPRPAASATRAAEDAPLPDPDLAGRLEDHPALELARSEISRREYAAARQRVYALLSIIDRMEDPRREAVEAECQFLIAQALHLEALERMGRAQ